MWLRPHQSTKLRLAKSGQTARLASEVLEMRQILATVPANIQASFAGGC